MFTRKAAVIILDFEQKALHGTDHLVPVREALITNVTKLEDEDILYVYSNQGELEAHATIGEAVAAISDFDERNVNLADAIKEVTFLLNGYGLHSVVFVLTNRYREDQRHRLANSFRYAADIFPECVYHLYGIGNHYNRSLAEFARLTKPFVTFCHSPAPSDINTRLTQDFSDFLEH